MNDVDNTFQPLTALSICTGIGGLERGVERAIGSIRTVAYVEIEAFIIENILAGMEAGVLAPAPIWANLKTFPWHFLRGKLFLLLGGYPCQPFSTAGRRLGEDDPRHLWPHIKRGLATARPVCVFFENVRGHLDLGAEQVLNDLRALGYAVEPGIYSAEEVGAPHHRARLFILGILADAKDGVRGLYERQWRSGTPQTYFTGSGEVLADSEVSGIGRASGNLLEKNGGSDGELQQQFDGSGSTMANTGCTEWRKNNPGRCGHNEDDIQERGEKAAGFTQCGEEMAYTQSGIGSGTWRGEGGQSELSRVLGNPQGDNERRQRDREARPKEQIGGSSGDIAHSDMSGQPAIWDNSESTGKVNSRTFNSGTDDRWPTGPGQSQYDWEETRTVESGMGCAINGYNFREDLLRALGNGVVEQTADLAFRELLSKHFS